MGVMTVRSEAELAAQDEGTVTRARREKRNPSEEGLETCPALRQFAAKQ